MWPPHSPDSSCLVAVSVIILRYKRKHPTIQIQATVQAISDIIRGAPIFPTTPLQQWLFTVEGYNLWEFIAEDYIMHHFPMQEAALLSIHFLSGRGGA